VGAVGPFVAATGERTAAATGGDQRQRLAADLAALEAFGASGAESPR
jgi:hypothetical protein